MAVPEAGAGPMAVAVLGRSSRGGFPARIRGCFADVSPLFRDVSRLFRGCVSRVSRRSRGCFTAVSQGSVG
eukprot:7176218-Prymnesium_polylepis.1